MSRREYPVADRYDDRESAFYRRPRHERNYEELDVDITRSRYPERRAETLVKEREPAPASGAGGRRQPEFLREDYGRTTAGPLVVRRKEVVEEEEEEEEQVRAPPRPRSNRGYEEEIVFREREGPARARSRPAPTRRGGSEEKVDIKIRREEAPAPAAPPPRREYREKDVEEITFRRGGGDRPREAGRERERERPREVEREEVRFVETTSPPPRAPHRGRDEKREVDIDIDIRDRQGRAPYRGREDYRERETIDIDIRQDRSRPPPRRDPSRGPVVARDREEWIVRRPRTPSPPPPPPRDFEREEIIIRRKERSVSPSPVRAPTPPPPPPPDPIVRPPIIQEVITHHRVIDHGVERARSPTPPPPPPAPPSPPREENLEIEIKRQGTRNGRPYEEDIIFEQDLREGGARSRSRAPPAARERSLSRSTTARRGQSIGPPARSRYDYDDPVSAEAEYYNRKIRERGYPGEAYQGATRDWGLVDIPPGTEKVRMDGAGGGAQEITWQRYNGERQGRFLSGDRDYRSPEFGAERDRLPPPAPAAPPSTRGGEERSTEVRITERRIDEGTRTGGGRTRDKMWTEITKDLVIREAVEECGYEYEETGDFFYVMEYLRYVRFPPPPFVWPRGVVLIGTALTFSIFQEDVLRLVSITEDIRRERRERIREIQWEREEMDRLPPPKTLPPPPPRGAFEEKVYERDYIYERDGRRFR